MKKIFTLIILLIVTKISLAQVPNLMNYQAVARNAQGQALANQAIKVRLSLIQLDAGGATTFYAETRSVTTNALGLFNVQVGSAGAQNVIGNINGTNWLDGSKTRSLKVEIDINNSNSFVDMGSQQLVSVPYALVAEKAREAESAKKISAPFVGFRAFMNLHTNWVGGSGTNKDLVYGYEEFDSLNVYNPSTGEFIAPEDGMYQLHSVVGVYNSTSYGDCTVRFSSSTRGNLQAIPGINNYGGSSFEVVLGRISSYSYSIITHLSKNEKVKVNVFAVSKSSDWQFNSNIGNYFEAYKIN